MISEKFLNNVAKGIDLPPLSPEVSELLAPVIELEVKKVIQQAEKFRFHCKSRRLSVDHINSALEVNGIEPIYGLSSDVKVHKGSNAQSSSSSSSATTSSSGITVEAEKIDLLDLARQPPPQPPLAPELNWHWLVVDNVQPRIPENPMVIVTENDPLPPDLPREMQFFYTRATHSIVSQDKTILPAVLHAFENDIGLQTLLPFFCQFIYKQIKNTTRSLPLLLTVVKASKCLLQNKSLHHEFHLHQLVPAMLTCVVGANVSGSPEDDHWSLRSAAAECIAVIVRRYRDSVVDLQPRICKTYLDAFKNDKSLVSVYGGVIGLTVLGHQVIRNLLLPLIGTIKERITTFTNLNLADRTHTKEKKIEEMEVVEDTSSSVGGSSSNAKIKKKAPKPREGDPKVLRQRAIDGEIVARCKAAVITALGKFMLKSMNSPSNTELGIGLLSRGKSDQSEEGEKLRKSLSSDEALVAELGEALIPYFVTSSNSMDHARMFL